VWKPQPFHKMVTSLIMFTTRYINDGSCCALGFKRIGYKSLFMRSMCVIQVKLLDQIPNALCIQSTLLRTDGSPKVKYPTDWSISIDGLVLEIFYRRSPNKPSLSILLILKKRRAGMEKFRVDVSAHNVTFVNVICDCKFCWLSIKGECWR